VIRNLRCQRAARRRGLSFLELQIAFVLLGIALAGLGPLVVMQSQQLRRLESRFNHQDTYYLVPSDDPWARKLGAVASIETVEPAAAAAPVTLVDNGGPGYSEIDPTSPYWGTQARAGAYGAEVRESSAAGDGDKAVWEFTGLEPGWYEVLVTWDAASGQAKNAPYTVYDGAAPEATVRVDQTVTPSGAIYQSVPWESLGVYSIVSGTLRVELSDDANAHIIADAVRIVPVRNVVEVLSVHKSVADEEVTAHVSVTVLTP
jgi:hypothetical protein